jgi:hypothetical protein
MCGETFELERPIGTAQRMTRCSCGDTARLVIGEGVNIAPSALETKGARVREIDNTEAGWSKDMAAYKRMRDRGMQPQAIDGSARLEDSVGDQLDVELQKMNKSAQDGRVSRKRYIEAAEQAAELIDNGVPR